MPRRTQRGDPEQLKMFMTPREIVNKYQVLDADRQEYHGEDARNYQRTGREERTGGVGTGNMWDPGNIHYAEGGSGDFIRQPIQETDEQVFARKNEEAQYDAEYYGEMRGHALTGHTRDFDSNREDLLERSSAPRMPSQESSSAWDSWQMKVDSYVNRKQDQHYQRQAEEPESLHESIAQGGVQHPVHLGTQFGSQGKPQIVGGHHRIAAALDTRPDDLIPVIHHEDIYDAKQSKGYKYR